LITSLAISQLREKKKEKKKGIKASGVHAVVHALEAFFWCNESVHNYGVIVK